MHIGIYITLRPVNVPLHVFLGRFFVVLDGFARRVCLARLIFVFGLAMAFFFVAFTCILQSRLNITAVEFQSSTLIARRARASAAPNGVRRSPETSQPVVHA